MPCSCCVSVVPPTNATARALAPQPASPTVSHVPFGLAIWTRSVRTKGPSRILVVEPTVGVTDATTPRAPSSDADLTLTSPATCTGCLQHVSPEPVDELVDVEAPLPPAPRVPVDGAPPPPVVSARMLSGVLAQPMPLTASAQTTAISIR